MTNNVSFERFAAEVDYVVPRVAVAAGAGLLLFTAVNTVDALVRRWTSSMRMQDEQKIRSQRRYEFVNLAAVVAGLATTLYLITKVFLANVVPMVSMGLALGGVWLAVGTVVALNHFTSRTMSPNV